MPSIESAKASMIRLLYHSQAVRPVSDAQTQDILESSRRNNEALGVTGVLVQGGDTYMQILEGPEESVLKLYVRILDDPRHRNCSILHVSPAHKRIFQKWSMGVVQSDSSLFEKLADLRDACTETIPAKAFTDTMLDFVRRLNAA